MKKHKPKSKLRLSPHKSNGGDFWWYEEPRGITAISNRNAAGFISWKALLSAARRAGKIK